MISASVYTVVLFFRRLNTLWFEYIKTVTNSHVYNPHSLVFKKLLNNLQNGAVFEASMGKIRFIIFRFMIEHSFSR
jgi:hypothetical protein